MNSFENAFYVLMGMALKGKEKVEDAAKKFAEFNKMNAEDGKKFVDDMVTSAETAKKDLSKQIEERVKSVTKKMGVPDPKEYDELKARVAKLEKALAAKPKAK